MVFAVERSVIRYASGFVRADCSGPITLIEGYIGGEFGVDFFLRMLLAVCLDIRFECLEICRSADFESFGGGGRGGDQKARRQQNERRCQES
jgi:hypothetical protein